MSENGIHDEARRVAVMTDEEAVEIGAVTSASRTSLEPWRFSMAMGIDPIYQGRMPEAGRATPV